MSILPEPTFFRTCDFIFCNFLKCARVHISTLPVIFLFYEIFVAQTFLVELRLDDVLEVLLVVGRSKKKGISSQGYLFTSPGILILCKKGRKFWFGERERRLSVILLCVIIGQAPLVCGFTYLLFQKTLPSVHICKLISVRFYETDKCRYLCSFGIFYRLYKSYKCIINYLRNAVYSRMEKCNLTFCVRAKNDAD